MLITLPLLIPMVLMLFSIHYVLNIWIQLILATIIQFYFGKRFYISSLKALLSKNSNITPDSVKENPDLSWNGEGMSSNTNINLEFIKENSDKDWDWSYISCNSAMDIEIIKSAAQAIGFHENPLFEEGEKRPNYYDYFEWRSWAKTEKGVQVFSGHLKEN